MKGLLLIAVAIVLTVLVGTVSTFVMIISQVFTMRLRMAYKTFDDFFVETAAGIDQTGNHLCKYLFNKVLIKGEGKVEFGDKDITVSAILGLNKLRGTLTRTGRFIAGTLNMIEKSHVEIAVDNLKLADEKAKDRFIQNKYGTSV